MAGTVLQRGRQLARKLTLEGDDDDHVEPAVMGIRSLVVKNTFYDTTDQRSASLERFYKQRQVASCPSSKIGCLANALNLDDYDDSDSDMVSTGEAGSLNSTNDTNTAKDNDSDSNSNSPTSPDRGAEDGSSTRGDSKQESSSFGDDVPVISDKAFGAFPNQVLVMAETTQSLSEEDFSATTKLDPIVPAPAASATDWSATANKDARLWNRFKDTRPVLSLSEAIVEMPDYIPQDQTCQDTYYGMSGYMDYGDGYYTAYEVGPYTQYGLCDGFLSPSMYDASGFPVFWTPPASPPASPQKSVLEDPATYLPAAPAAAAAACAAEPAAREVPRTDKVNLPKRVSKISPAEAPSPVREPASPGPISPLAASPLEVADFLAPSDEPGSPTEVEKQASEDTATVNLEDLPSIGSVGHHDGTCKPCAFFHSSRCGNDKQCLFCHICDNMERKKRRRDKVDARRRFHVLERERKQEGLEGRLGKGKTDESSYWVDAPAPADAAAASWADASEARAVSWADVSETREPGRDSGDRTRPGERAARAGANSKGSRRRGADYHTDSSADSGSEKPPRSKGKNGGKSPKQSPKPSSEKVWTIATKGPRAPQSPSEKGGRQTWGGRRADRKAARENL